MNRREVRKRMRTSILGFRVGQEIHLIQRFRTQGWYHGPYTVITWEEHAQRVGMTHMSDYYRRCCVPYAGHCANGSSTGTVHTDNIDKDYHE